MGGLERPTDRALAAARKELYSRRSGRAGVGPCPNPVCGVFDEHGVFVRSLVVLVVYVPKNRFDPAAAPAMRRRRRGGHEGDAPRLVFDFPAEARSNEYANYATTNAFERARLLPDDEESLLPPLQAHEYRLCLHIARHPECEPFLTAPKDLTR